MKSETGIRNAEVGNRQNLALRPLGWGQSLILFLEAVAKPLHVRLRTQRTYEIDHLNSFNVQITVSEQYHM